MAKIPESDSNDSATLEDVTTNAKETQEETQEYVWYLAYGSNLHPKVLEGRRKVYPRESLACRVPSYKLVFTCPGIPYMEPCCASIAPSDDLDKDKNGDGYKSNDGEAPYLHGVAHHITAEEFEKVQKTEGGGGYPDLGYNVVNVNVMTYDNRSIECITLLWVLNEDEKKSNEVPQPSKRYWKLLVDGSKHHGLDSEYQAWLQQLSYYVGPTTLSTRLGRAITLTFAASMGIPILSISKLYKYRSLRSPRWIYVFMGRLSGILFTLHDWILEPILGSGVVSDIDYILADKKDSQVKID